MLMICAQSGMGARHLAGQALLRPDLSVRVRVAATHDTAFVFKDLDMIDVRQGAQAEVFLYPGVHHGTDLSDR